MEILVAGAFATFLAVTAWTDLKTLMIYDKVLIPMATVGIFFDACNLLVPLDEGIIFGGGGFLLMFSILKLSRGGLGGGDVKFSAVLGIWLGAKIFSAIFVASILAAAVGIIFFLRGNRKIKIPFAPFLAVGAFVAYFFEITI